jgi:Prophage tail length tape measure protein
MSDVDVTFGGDINELKQTLGSLTSYVKGFGDGVKRIGVAAFASWAANKVITSTVRALREAVGAMKEWVAAGVEVAQVEAQLAAAIESTGMAAGFTAEQLKKHAKQLQDITLFEDEATIAAQTMLTRFRSIKGDEFKEVTELALDMAQRLGQDASSAANQLGIALENPVLGMQRLRRSGVILDTDTQRLIKTLYETGRTASAQQVLIEELEKAFGGAAEAAAKAGGGPLKQLQITIGDLKEELGLALLPAVDAIADNLKDKLAPVVQDLVADFGDWAANLEPSQIDSFTDSIINLTKSCAQLASSLSTSLLPMLQGMLDSVSSIVDSLSSGDEAARMQQSVDKWSEESFKAVQKRVNEIGELGWNRRPAAQLFDEFGLKRGESGIRQDYEGLRRALQARQDRANAAITQRHRLSGIGGGADMMALQTLGVANRMLLPAAGVQKQTVQTRQTIGELKELFKMTEQARKISGGIGATQGGFAGTPNFIGAMLGLPQAQLRGMGGPSSRTLNKAGGAGMLPGAGFMMQMGMAAGMQALGLGLGGEAGPAAHQAQIEDLQSTFTRIQRSAASRGAEDREKQMLTLTERIAKAHEKSETHLQKLASMGFTATLG